jgi:acetyl esterase/lipase
LQQIVDQTFLGERTTKIEEAKRIMKEFSPPNHPSLSGRIATRTVRMVVKHWKRGDPPAAVRRARKVFGLPNFINALHVRGLEVEKVDVPADGEQTVAVRGEWIRPRPCAVRDRVVLYLHGGGYVSCSPQTHRPITSALARLLQCPVFALDYRVAPEHKFPAAVDDAAACFRWLVASGVHPEKIAIAGDSAGGGLALATTLRLRSEGHGLPGCVVGLSPWVDLTGAGPYRNAGSCSMFQPSEVATFAKLYLQGAPAEVPEASPVLGDLCGLPPLLIQASSTELLMDDAVRLHEKAGKCSVESTLTVYPGLPHVWQILIGAVPEARMALEQIADFMSSAWERRDVMKATQAGAPLPQHAKTTLAGDPGPALQNARSTIAESGGTRGQYDKNQL